MRFSRHFGELDWAPIAAARVKVPGEDRYIEVAPEGRQYVMVISNVIEDGQPIGQLGAYEAIWHTDMSYIERAAERLGPVFAGGAAVGRRYRLLQHVSRL